MITRWRPVQLLFSTSATAGPYHIFISQQFFFSGIYPRYCRVRHSVSRLLSFKAILCEICFKYKVIDDVLFDRRKQPSKTSNLVISVRAAFRSKKSVTVLKFTSMRCFSIANCIKSKRKLCWLTCVFL